MLPRRALLSPPSLVRAYRRSSARKPGAGTVNKIRRIRPREVMDPNVPMPSTDHKKVHMCLSFGFCGTGYHGLQSQPDKPQLETISGTLRAALHASGAIALTNLEPETRTKWTLASRTDKGVHASGAAVSFKMETLPDELEHLDNGRVVLAPAAIDRINALLPEEVRLLSGARVRKSFNARKCASTREYEYLLPVSALGAADRDEAHARVLELDRLLSLFEGTHRVHNFSSGLRTPGLTYEDETSGESWPLALDLSERGGTASAFRSVLCARVRRVLRLGGEEYVVLRIVGLAFVLHQIRHMVGAAIAATRGAVPRDAIELGLASPLQVDLAPLAPGCGLILDRIHWYEMVSGLTEVEPTAADLERGAAFKRDVVYPHVHALYSKPDSELKFFLDSLSDPNAPNFCSFYTGDELARLRRLLARWEQQKPSLTNMLKHGGRLSEVRRPEPQQALEEVLVAQLAAATAKQTAAPGDEQEEEDDGAEPVIELPFGKPRRRVALSAAGSPVNPNRLTTAAVAAELPHGLADRARQTGADSWELPEGHGKPLRLLTTRDKLPGGLQVRICVQRGLVPGPMLREMVWRLSEAVDHGTLQAMQPHEIYLQYLDAVYGRVAPPVVDWDDE